MPSTRRSRRSTTRWCDMHFRWPPTRTRSYGFLSGGQTAARSVVPPFFGLRRLERFRSRLAGGSGTFSRTIRRLREQLMRIAGAGRLVFDLTFPNRPAQQRNRRRYCKSSGAQISAPK